MEQREEKEQSKVFQKGLFTSYEYPQTKQHRNPVAKYIDKEGSAIKFFNENRIGDEFP